MHKDFSEENASDFWKKAAHAHNTAILALESGDVDGAINRAYYAMRHAAIAVLLDSREPPPGYKHATLIGAFGLFANDSHPELKDMGRAFNHAAELRNTADYHFAPVSIERAQAVVAQADEFLHVAYEIVEPTLESDESSPSPS